MLEILGLGFVFLFSIFAIVMCASRTKDIKTPVKDESALTQTVSSESVKEKPVEIKVEIPLSEQKQDPAPVQPKKFEIRKSGRHSKKVNIDLNAEIPSEGESEESDEKVSSDEDREIDQERSTTESEGDE